jgi:hypothetical protein
MHAQGDWLHIDNAKTHNSAPFLHKTEELASRLGPPYSYDSVFFDFFRSGSLKKELQETNFRP